MDSFWFTQSDQETNSSAVFEDDGRVAYAYLLHHQQIVADVWLYNHGKAPERPEWNDPSNAPFANPKGFAEESQVVPIRDESAIHFVWTHDQQKRLIQVDVLLFGEVYGRLTPTSRPGWSKLASKDGPLAKVLIGEVKG